MKILKNEDAALLRGGVKLLGSVDTYNPSDCRGNQNPDNSWQCKCSGTHAYYFFGIRSAYDDSVIWNVYGACAD